MKDFFLFSLVLVAIFIGWVLGRRASLARPDRVEAKHGLSEDYFRGLNFLLNEQSDKAIDVFIQRLEVNSDTIETHLALGKMFCRRGEVDRAIKVHQNLLATPSLDDRQQFKVRLELAKDYLAAGLLDRAEKNFHDLLEVTDHGNQECLRSLLQIYEHEQEWKSAIKIAKKLDQIGDAQAAQFIAHYYCELAQGALQQNNKLETKKNIKKALAYDAESVRASLLEGQIEYQEKNYAKAIQALKRISLQDPDYIPESVEPLKQCYQKLGKEAELVSYFVSCLEDHPAITVVLALAEITGSQRGDTAAANIIANYLKQAPSIRGLNRLIDFHIAHSKGKARENLSILRELTENLIAHKPVYHCANCGYSGNVLYWLCPSCRQWGMVKPIHGLEGE